jgi:diguanylate cyclase (GGDEF)-like protein
VFVKPQILVACGAYFVLFLGWELFGWGGSARPLLGTGFFVVLFLAAGVAAWCASRRSKAEPRTASAWRWIAGALASVTAGFVAAEIYAAYGLAPFPSVVDVFFIASYPLFVIGLLRFPTRPQSRRGHVTVALDVTVVVLGGAAVIWYLVLGPTVTTGQGFLVTATAGAYPIGDLLEIIALTYVIMRGRTPGTQRPLQLLVAGTLIVVVGDVLNSWVLLHPGAAGAKVANVLWMAGWLLYIPAAFAQRRPRPPAKQPQRREAPAGRATWLPYLAPAVVFGLLLVVQKGNAFYPGFSITIAAVLVGAFVLLRQRIAQRDLVAAHKELAALATTDPLTALPNHRALVDAIDGELERTVRYEHTSALLFLDIDHFKALNDGCGHAAGDAALHELGRVAQSTLRTIDTVGRWGGEEFVAVLPEVDDAGAMASAERLRAAIAAHPFDAERDLHCTVSVGVAIYPRDGRTRSELLEAADRAMYGAKRLGRNQARSAADPAVGAVAALAQPELA